MLTDLLSRITLSDKIEYDFFISYSRRDGSHYARALADQIQRNKLTFFLDAPEAVGHSLPFYLKKALNRSRFVILIGSAGAVESNFIKEEIRRAHDLSKPIVVIDVAKAYVNSDLASSYSFSYFSESDEALKTGRLSERLVETIGQISYLKRAFSISWLSRFITSLRSIFRSERGAPGIFISYRTEDAAGYALWLYEVMRTEFRSRLVFIDVAQIEVGSNFDEAIKRALNECKVLTALIGKRWLSSSDSDGNARLRDPKDYVYLEVSTALANRIVLLPVLLDGAAMPRQEDLPSAISSLSYLKAVEIRPREATEDIKKLLRAIQKGLKT